MDHPYASFVRAMRREEHARSALVAAATASDNSRALIALALGVGVALVAFGGAGRAEAAPSPARVLPPPRPPAAPLLGTGGPRSLIVAAEGLADRPLAPEQDEALRRFRCREIGPRAARERGRRLVAEIERAVQEGHDARALLEGARAALRLARLVEEAVETVAWNEASPAARRHLRSCLDATEEHAAWEQDEALIAGAEAFVDCASRSSTQE